MTTLPLDLTAAVCTRDRPALAERALRSLAAQVPPPAEILVIENVASSAAVRAAARRVGARYVHEPVPGLDVARNQALRSARAGVVAFLDDDAVADPGWAGALAAALHDPRVGVCTGRVDALMLGTPGETLFEANGGFARGARPLRLPRDAHRPLHGLPAPLIAWAVSVGNGCSMAVRRGAALAIGGFDDALDRGPALPGGGDLDLIWRMLEAGHDLVYEPAARARHEHRATEREVHTQIAGHQRALTAFLWKTTRQTPGTRRLPIAAFLAWRLVKPAARLTRRAFGRDPLPVPVLMRMWREAWRGLTASHVGLRRLSRPEHETSEREEWTPASSS